MLQHAMSMNMARSTLVNCLTNIMISTHSCNVFLMTSWGFNTKEGNKVDIHYQWYIPKNIDYSFLFYFLLAIQINCVQYREAVWVNFLVTCVKLPEKSWFPNKVLLWSMTNGNTIKRILETDLPSLKVIGYLFVKKYIVSTRILWY